jgi:hypothetical protein
MELRKAVVLFDKMLAKEPVPMQVSRDEKYASKSRKMADVQVIVVMSSVCRDWSRIFATSHHRILRSIISELICL